MGPDLPVAQSHLAGFRGRNCHPGEFGRGFFWGTPDIPFGIQLKPPTIGVPCKNMMHPFPKVCVAVRLQQFLKVSSWVRGLRFPQVYVDVPRVSRFVLRSPQLRFFERKHVFFCRCFGADAFVWQMGRMPAGSMSLDFLCKMASAFGMRGSRGSKTRARKQTPIPRKLVAS